MHALRPHPAAEENPPSTSRREPSASATAHALPPDVPLLLVGPAAGWFELTGGDRVDLRRRGALRLILEGLMEQRLRAPGVGLCQQALAELGWPGERILPEAAATRVYTAVRTLRTLGLGATLRRHADGYLLDPELPAVRAL